MSEKSLQTFSNSLHEASTQAEAYGYRASPALPYHSSGTMPDFVENFRKFQECLKEYSKVERLLKVIEEGKVDITEMEVREGIDHIGNLLEILRSVISNNYKIIMNLQKAACPSKFEIPEERRAEFSRMIKDLLSLSFAADKLDAVMTQLQRRIRDPSATIDNRMINIFGEALTIFDRLTHNTEPITHATDMLLHPPTTSHL